MKNKYKIVLGLLLLILGGFVLIGHIVIGAKMVETKATIESVQDGKASIRYEVDGKSYLVIEPTDAAVEGDDILIYYSKSDPALINYFRYNTTIIICSSIVALCGLVVLLVKERR